MSLHADTRRLARSVLRLGSHRIDIGALRVLDRGDAGRLTPKSLALLLELARHPLQTVTRDELLDRLWADSDPTPDALSHAVRELRRALGDNPRSPQLVGTVRGLGYRLCVEPVIEPPAAPPTPPAPAAQAVPSPRSARRARRWPWLMLGTLLLASAGFGLYQSL